MENLTASSKVNTGLTISNLIPAMYRINHSQEICIRSITCQNTGSIRLSVPRLEVQNVINRVSKKADLNKTYMGKYCYNQLIITLQDGQYLSNVVINEFLANGFLKQVNF
jgi:hypothetical protein